MSDEEPWDDILNGDMPAIHVYKGIFMRAGEGWLLKVERSEGVAPPKDGTPVEVSKADGSRTTLIVTQVVVEHSKFWECRFRQGKFRKEWFPPPSTPEEVDF
jgi:hypothetical protein